MFDELLRYPRGSTEKRLETEGDNVEETLFHVLCVCENTAKSVYFIWWIVSNLHVRFLHQDEI